MPILCLNSLYISIQLIKALSIEQFYKNNISLLLQIKPANWRHNGSHGCLFFENPTTSLANVKLCSEAANMSDMSHNVVLVFYL